jgi:SAM-dependent methyltransferase
MEGDELSRQYGEEFWFFQDHGSGVAWDAHVYSPGTYDWFIWEMQQKWLREVAASVRAAVGSLSHLDFACGTGRVLAATDGLATARTGIDLSADMVSVAQTKLPHAEFRIGDILESPNLIDHDFDLITAFRFFLGTEPAVRDPIMASLATHLSGPRARLVFNIHGNDWSVLGLKRRLGGTRWVGDGGVTMSLPEVVRMVDAAGLKVVEWRGYGLSPRALHRKPWIGRSIDRLSGGLPVTRWFSKDLVVVCRLR